MICSVVFINFNFTDKEERTKERRKKKKKKSKKDSEIKPGEDRTIKKSRRVFIEGDKEVIVTITEETIVRPLRKDRKENSRKVTLPSKNEPYYSVPEKSGRVADCSSSTPDPMHTSRSNGELYTDPMETLYTTPSLPFSRPISRSRSMRS